MKKRREGRRTWQESEATRGIARPEGLERTNEMKKAAFLGCVTVLSAIGWARADPVDLSAYVDANGFIDVQALTCAQLANTYQSDANVLMAWYSGWYNGLGHKHYMDYKKGRELEHLVIEYCKAHTDETIIHAIGVNLKDMRAEGLMQEK
jgi:hypothetical protein